MKILEILAMLRYIDKISMFMILDIVFIYE